MRAGDDQHGDGADYGIRGAADDAPNHGGDGGGSQRKPEQPGGRAVGESLRARRGVLSIGDEALNPRECRVVSDRGHPDSEGAVGGDGSGDDAGTDRAGDGARLSGDHRLVDIRGALNHLSVDRNAAAGANDDDVAQPQFGWCHGDHVVAVDFLRLIGQQRGKRVEGARGLRQGAHLDPVAQQHDHDQKGELPPEVERGRQQA